MEKVIKEELTKYLDDNMYETIDRYELQSIVQKVILKMLLEIRTDEKYEEEP